MAIFGAGSTWYGSDEKKDYFFEKGIYEIGWDYPDAKDLYDAFSLLKAGDIIYLKSSSPGSRDIRVKGVGIVTTSFLHSLFLGSNPSKLDIESEEITVRMQVKWIIKNDFYISIPMSEGKMTNVRAATFYEESLPYVQKEIIDKLFP
ncbi:hypothetical protein [Hymenobacter sediminicola]|uniref:Uncharacterized protein n=1 Tax=Hymenobacter sediminicola TaxID=2761579 RepID=A0A7G7W3Q8_9BACT|nr:hypothetical protein [Hymenobacter sediminicola]QNH61001.1 hypothetical protein H4317_12510 [Hymenobacter sediminicola]